MKNNLQVIIKESGLEETKANFLLDNFKDYFKIASEWEIKAKAIVVDNGSQKAEMDMARAGRLFLREKRIAIENSRKELKEQSLREGRAIDGISNVLKSLIVPIEKYLDRQEHFVEIKEKEDAEALRIETEEKLEKERLENERLEKIEQERMKAENEKLKKEADRKEKIRLKREEKVEKERDKVEKERQLERDKVEKERQLERDKVEKERQLERDKVEKERADAEDKRQKMIKKQEDLQKELASMIECPKCHHKFNLK